MIFKLLIAAAILYALYSLVLKPRSKGPRMPEDEAALAQARDTLAAAGFDVDYVAFADAGTLEAVTAYEAGRPLRLLAAARIGTTRLIDNIALPE